MTQLCSFTVAGLSFGLPVTDVQEVVGGQRVTRVPLAPDDVHGLINLRGQIVVVLDLRKMLELTPAPATTSADLGGMNVVARTPSGPLSFLVDDVADVVDVTGVKLERLPETVSPALRETMTGVYKLVNALLIVMDLGAIVRRRGSPRERKRK